MYCFTLNGVSEKPLSRRCIFLLPGLCQIAATTEEPRLGRAWNGVHHSENTAEIGKTGDLIPMFLSGRPDKMFLSSQQKRLRCLPHSIPGFYIDQFFLRDGFGLLHYPGTFADPLLDEQEIRLPFLLTSAKILVHVTRLAVGLALAVI